MKFTRQFLDEIIARLPVSEIVGKRVKLKRAGREWKGLSPFQQEKSPSFTVNDQKGFYHDFSSGKHGNVFDFVMETEGVTFPEAVERLAVMAGLQLPVATPEAARREERRKTLYDVMELAAKFFADTLASRNGAAAVPPRLRDGRTLCAEGASRRPRHSRERHGGSRAPGGGRRHSRAV
jgi:DNA primase